MCVGLCPTYWTTFGNAEKNRNGSCPQHEWDHHACFEFLTPLPRPQRSMDPRGGGGTSADIVPKQIKFGVDPSTRCWDIAQKPPKCKNSPLTPIVTKISFPPLFPSAGSRWPPKGEKTHPEPEFARMQTLAWIGPRVVEKSLTEQNKNLTIANRSRVSCAHNSSRAFPWPWNLR